MITFDIITIFPNIFSSYLKESIISRAIRYKKVKINFINPRDFTEDKHKTVDDRPYGGGPGMVFKIELLVKAISSLKLKSNPPTGGGKVKIILFSTSGKQFSSKIAALMAKKYNRIIMIAGHYEGVDERIFGVLKAMGHKPEAISIGPYVLTGGELPAMVIFEAVTRHIPGVLGKAESLEEKRYGVGVPVYTRPEIFTYPLDSTRGKKSKKYVVPNILLSGDHKKIEKWRKEHRSDILF